MRRIVFSACVIFALFLGGCGKNGDNKKLTSLGGIFDKETHKIADNQGIPVYDSKEEVFDFDEEGVKGFDFVTDEEVVSGGEVNAKVAKNDPGFTDEDLWEDDSLEFAWDEESDDAQFQVVKFDLNKNTIRDDQKAAVKENVKLAKAATESGQHLVISGHCCPLGSASYNMSLSEKRAKAISDEMVRNGVEEDKITILGCGSEHPIVLSDATSRAQKVKELADNRRAEITIN